MRALASVPAKVILAGEHSAVYGHPAIVAALGKRLEARLEPSPEADGLGVLALGERRHWSWRELLELVESSQSATGATSEASQADSAHRFLALSVGEAMREYCPAPSGGYQLSVESEIPVGRGFGSSAAASLAVVAAVAGLAAGSSNVELDVLERIALRAEAHQHATPSGIDTATVLRGGALWIEREGEELRINQLTDRSGWLEHVALYDSGEPEQSTGEVVAAVRRRLDAEPELEHDLLGLSRVCRVMKGFFDEFSDQQVAACLAEAHRRLVHLGVVTEDVAQHIDELARLGCPGKISGAGALEGSGSGAVLLYYRERQSHLSSAATREQLPEQWQCIDAALGVDGLALTVSE